MSRNHLKTLRLNQNLTQRDVANRAGCSVSYYTEIERGKKQLNEKMARGIAMALGVTPAVVFGNEQPPSLQPLPISPSAVPVMPNLSEVAQEPDLNSQTIEVILRNGRAIRFHVDTEASAVKRMIQTVEAS